MLFEGVWVFGLIVSGPGLISSMGLDDGGGGGASGLCVHNGSGGVWGLRGGGAGRWAIILWGLVYWYFLIS